MKNSRAGALGLLLALVTASAMMAAPAKAPATPASFDLSSIEIKHQKFVLDNGLTLIVHEDRKAPIVAVNVWYHVGSKNEPAGRSGFAHLFEHLMFNGSENYNDDYFQPLERVGATGLNGTTNEDRTNYFQNVPTSALDLVLWMESDRMGHLLGAIDQAKLDEQRGVVQNEKRQWENQPYAVAEELITKATFPSHHPYSHTVIGSMEDLDAASLEDVKDWFKTYYGAANAVLVVAGDIDAETALEKVKKYFGDIPAGPPVARFDQWPAKLTEVQRQVVADRVPQARLMRIYNIPGWGSTEAVHLDLVTDVLGAGKTSRLYKRLVYDDQIATNVSVGLDLREIGGQFRIEITARPGDDLKKVEAVLDEELAKFLKDGPTPAEVERVKTEYFARFTRGIERIGGFGGKSDILAQSIVYGGSPDAYMNNLKVYAATTAADLHKAAKAWMTGGEYNLEIHPYPQFKAAAEGADRSKLPDTGTPPAPEFPAMQKATLANGLNVIVATRESIPVVNMNLIVDSGYASDLGAKAGTAGLAMNMLDEGTKTRSAMQIADELARLGATLSTGTDLDTATVFMSALESNLDKSLALYADVILNPSFPQSDFALLQKQQVAQIQREKANPMQMGLRVVPKLLYGDGHAYATPFTGTGTEPSVMAMTTADLAAFHSTWFKPNNATLVIVGATTLDEMKPKLEKAFASWKGGDVPKKNVSDVTLPKAQRVFLVDKPGAQQSTIFAGHVAPPRNHPDDVAIEQFNQILGGSFTSRVNMNLREEKGWSYGTRTVIAGARGQRPFIAMAPVQTDKTKESVQELVKEFAWIVGDKPATQDEVDKVKAAAVLRLPGSWETNGAVGGSIAEIIRFGLAENYFDTYPGRVSALSIDDVRAAGKAVLHPEAITWVIVGDLAKIRAGVEELGLGPVTVIDADGNAVN
jgi:zinc protease